MTGRKIVLGTKNKDKLKELQSLLKKEKVGVLSLANFPHCPEARENGKTFEANAQKKASAYSKHTQMLTLADDSGLMVSALNGKPGVYSARFAGAGCTYEDNNRKLLRLLKNKPLSKRSAKFVSVIAVYNSGRLLGVAKGECRGKIAFSERGSRGFGYDPVFIPEGFSRTYAELSPLTKNRISHRGRALRAVKKILLKALLRQSKEA